MLKIAKDMLPFARCALILFNKVSSDKWALPIERFKIMEKEIDIFGNLLMTMNWIMDGKIK
jgi:hypothetical protein